MIPLKYYAYLAAVLALAGFAFYVHHLQTSNTKLTAELSTAKATIVAQELNVRKANAASKLYQDDLTRISTERSNVPVVRLCHSPAVRSSAAPAGSDATSAGHVGEAPASDIGPDIGNALLEYGIACEANQLQLTRLQEWVRNR